jgi:hypothetical protein
MRVILFAQVAAAALFVSGCPGAPVSNPTGGCAPGTNCSTGGFGGEGGSGNNGGAAGSGNGGKGGSGGGSGGSSSSANGGAGGSGNSGNGGAGGSGNGGSGQGGSGGGGNPMVCGPLELEVVKAQETAQSCNPEIGGPQCQNMIEGLCCPISVENANSPEVLAYLEALKKYLEAGCNPMCPPDPCPVNPTPDCKTTMGMQGACVP